MNMYSTHFVEKTRAECGLELCASLEGGSREQGSSGAIRVGCTAATLAQPSC